MGRGVNQRDCTNIRLPDTAPRVLRGWSHAMSHGHSVGDCAATR
jgi:hypothetical protein